MYLLIVGALIAIAIHYATSGPSGPPAALALLQRYSLPLLVATLLLGVVGAVWRHLMDRPRRPTWRSARPPYPGLEAFTEDDAAVFFGRDVEISLLMDRLNPANAESAHRFVAVIGPSGVGKSSLIQAGLAPRLALLRRPWAILPPMTPEHQPMHNLARSLATADGRIEDADRIAAELARGPEALSRHLEALRTAKGDRSARVLLILDQAEELLTMTPESERTEFLDLLRHSLWPDRRLWAIATLRSEFLTAFLQAGCADLFRNPVVLGALGRAALLEVIEKPAATTSITFAPRVVIGLVADTGSGDALPLLAYTLQALYLRAQARSDDTITEDDYRALGGVSGILAARADKVAAELAADPAAAPVLPTLLKFVTLEEGEATRRRVRRGMLTPAEHHVADAFIGERLLSSAASEGGATIQVAHEALFRQWVPLRQAIEARNDDLRQRAQFERWAQDWDASGRRDSFLLRDDRLLTAQQWMSNHGAVAAEMPLVHRFLHCSAQSDRTAMQRLSESVARRSLASIDQDPELGLLLAVAAIVECAATPQAHRALLAALNACRLRRVLRGHERVVRGVDWSPDGSRLATASQDMSLRIWDAESGAQLLALRGHTDWIRGVAWSPNGRLIATAGEDLTARVWDAIEGAEVSVLHGHLELLHAVAWAPDGLRLVTGSHDGTARIWNARSARELHRLEGHTDWVRGVAWSPDGRRVATGSSDGRARVWDAESGTLETTLYGHTDWVQGLAWSPDGRWLATASSDRSARIWDVATATATAQLTGHTDWVHHVAWSPDSQRVVTVSRDRTARIWEANTAAEVAVIRGHSDWVHGVAWSPDGERLATASYDQLVRVWDAKAPTEVAVLRGHKGWVQAVAWSLDGSERVASASHDGTARVWDACGGGKLAVLRGHESWVHDVAWSPDGRRLVTSSRDRTARIWDIGMQKEVCVLRGHTNWVEYVAWSPDGARVATGSNDRRARIWDAETGACLLTLDGHADWVRTVAWSPDGLGVATASNDRTVRVWDAIRGVTLHVLQGHRHWVNGVSWSPDRRRLATASSDWTARIWDVTNGQLAELTGHEDAVLGVAWSPDGRRLATASADRTARIWDAMTGAPLGILCVHGDAIEDVAWSPDGSRVATASRDHTAQIWHAGTDVDMLVSIARQRVLRELSPEERKSAMLPETAAVAGTRQPLL